MSIQVNQSCFWCVLEPIFAQRNISSTIWRNFWGQMKQWSDVYSTLPTSMISSRVLTLTKQHLSSTLNPRTYSIAGDLISGNLYPTPKSYNSESFLKCLKRFASRRGLPPKFVSTNRKTFKAASKYIKAVFEDHTVKEHLAGIGCE